MVRRKDEVEVEAVDLAVEGGKVEAEKKEVELEDLPGVGPATAEKLRKSGYDTLEKIATSSAHELEEVADITVETAKKTIEAARDALEMGYESADKIYERRKAVCRLTTGSKSLDELIGGGVETQSITESYGRFSSGKTQLAFQLSVNVQKPTDQGGLGGSVLYIDTESTFRPERVKQMAEAAGMDGEQALKNIHVARAVNSDHQIILIDKADEMIKEKNVKLLIVDSLTSHFQAEFIGRGQLADRQQKLNRHMHTLQKIAEMNNVALLVTNQVMERPDILFGDPTAPIGGNIVGHASKTRLYLRKSKDDRRVAKLVDSPSLPDGEAIYRITEKGIEDAE